MCIVSVYYKYYRIKIKVEEQNRVWLCACMWDAVVREGFSNQMAFKVRSDRSTETKHEDI